ncbi:MAG: Biotin operon repressor / Biotin--protein ligase [Rhodanobacteraceae bacterium]|jgi:BirA family biotin operon repressor/biotin-[acetyl-CoA-carboxylase] ligase|nr:MAG: Biotin operon repressor / Biotin--protein ligase [Rhodanobacteraceae bacterium]
MLKSHLDTSRRRVPAGRKTAHGAAEAPAVLALLASGGCHAGPDMARRLGISRAAVWKQIEALRAAGLDVQSSESGYCLEPPLEWIDPATIHAGLPAAIRRRVGGIENHWRLDSTSSECLRRAGELPDRSFVFADWQDAGRGRRGRQWVSPPATNLQFSCLKRFAGGYAALSGLSLAVGIAVADALEDCGARGIGLKWPNDLVHGDAKLGGILIELGGEFMGPCHAVVGVGINLRAPPAMRRALDRPCTDLRDVCGGKAPSRNALASALVARLVEALDLFDDSGFAAFADAWNARDALNGRAIRVDGARGVFEGTAAGVDARGALRVRRNGGVESLDSAEVTVRAK